MTCTGELFHDACVGSVLVHGPSGSGKTALVDAMARCAGVHAVRPTAQQLFSASSQAFGGAGAMQLDQRLRLIVKEVEALAPAILIFDEAQNLFPNGA
jgi:SpoVK/Ycf46/Vps4 family AAA+-type ATPase